MKIEFPYGASLALKGGLVALAVGTFLGFGLGVLLCLPFILFEVAASYVARFGRFVAAWFVAYGVPFLKRVGVRVAFAAFVPLLGLGWVLALPYAALDWSTRRDHLRDGREMFLTKDSWRDIGIVLKTGRFN